MDQTLDIVKLIEENPVTRLTSTYQSKLLNKIKEKFNSEEQQLFVASFYCYLNYSNDEFVVDLDDIWKWLGFSVKHKAKVIIVKNFQLDIEYQLYDSEQQVKINGGAGMNKEKILLTVKTFKLFCMKANTSKASKIHEYFINLEEVLHEVIDEESSELRQQLEETKTKLKKSERKNNLLLNRKYYDALPGDLIYIRKDYKKNANGKSFIYKVGKTKKVRGRETFYSNIIKSSDIVFSKYCYDCNLTERVIHHVLDKYRMIRDQEWFDFPDEMLFVKTVESIIDIMDGHIDVIDTFIPTLHNFLDIKEDDGRPKRKQTEREEEIENYNKPNPKDFTKFINECCEMSPEYRQPKSEVKQAHRVWSKCSSKDVVSALDEYLKENLQSAYFIDNDIKRNCFKGIRLKPLVFTSTNEPVKDYEQFILENCKTDYQYRISYVDFFEKFVEWKHTSEPEFVVTAKYKKAIQKDLETVFAGGRVHLSSTADSRHLFGLWGLGMEFNNFGLKTPERTCKKVGQYNEEGVLIKSWESLSVASRELDIACSSLSNYCRFNNVFNKHVYKYIDVI